jgi:dTDP-glucose 4,6-dehydratase
MNRTILVTGGAGFIGAHFVRLAVELTQFKILVLDSLTYAGDLQRLEEVQKRCPDRVHFIKGDICSIESLNNLFQQFSPEKIVHFAAESHVDRSILNPFTFLKTNIEGTVNLLSVASECWGREKSEDCLFLHVSTDEVFGELAPEDPSFTHESPYDPNSPYSASKAASDHFVRSWGRTYGLPFIITNCSNNYGPWQFPEKLIPLMIQNAIEGKKLPIYGDGMQVRDWIHVEDHCLALLAVLESGQIGQTYMIGADEEHANKEIVELVCDLVDEKQNRSAGSTRDLVEYVTDRPGHDRRYAIDSSKITEELGWQPKYEFRISISNLVDWMLANQEWVQSILNEDYRKFYNRQYGAEL